ncbi:MAG: hypothetical protein ATN35_00215 [Epulopiscium sp. Nele67-Bin004]|nr:MAG: hypothetical protein ATN35_00215 [Epulopiscium sp. Nele67-Bin004]
MNFESCKQCKRLFNYIEGKKICIKCEAEEKLKLDKARGCLIKNPAASIDMISHESGFSTKQVAEFFREGELEITEESPIELQCEKCKTKIFKGNICVNCKEQKYSAVKEAHKELSEQLAANNLPPTKSGGRMYTRR